MKKLRNKIACKKYRLRCKENLETLQGRVVVLERILLKQQAQIKLLEAKVSTVVESEHNLILLNDELMVKNKDLEIENIVKSYQCSGCMSRDI